MKYDIKEHESGCGITVETDTIDAAIKQAKAWLADGDYDDEESFVGVTITDETGVQTNVDCIVGGVTPPVCLKNKHKWESPHEVVGGHDGNPGVWSLDGGRCRAVEVCCHCGCYRRTTTESSPDQWPRTPERVTYNEPDKKSLIWAGLLNDCEDA